ncbi:hypothetical protein [Terrarubrum flagellatum]|uniref:hypothetical protein n=1 Tax=Terrirubrum flagellatum TaxID=2895980 RepID=UPI0031456345
MKGKWIRLSPARRFITDLSYFARRTPIGVIRRKVNIAPAIAARKASPARIPWTVLFAKAFSLAAQNEPELRRTYALLPWPHLHQLDISVASIMIERVIDGERVVLPARIKNPAERSLTELATALDEFVTKPIEEIDHLDTILMVSKWPLLIRRLLWFFAFNIGRMRPNFFGTFGMSVLGHKSANINFPVSPVTSFLSYGPFEPNGDVEITMSFDHRTFDGALIAETMGVIAEKLNGPLAEELASLDA